jgi:hypothetical protein
VCAWATVNGIPSHVVLGRRGITVPALTVSNVLPYQKSELGKPLTLPGL